MKIQEQVLSGTDRDQWLFKLASESFNRLRKKLREFSFGSF